MASYDTVDFTEKCQRFGLTLSQEQISQFMDYYELLIEWNSFMNLTTITDFHEVVLKHFVDSLAIYQFKEFKELCQVPGKSESIIQIEKENQDISLIDIGTGAGFPGIPLKIMFPELKVTLLDSLQKRINYLNAVIEKLELKDIEVVHGRAEDYGINLLYREKYSFCVSRAVAHLSTLSELCIPFVKKNGYFISYKSGKIKEEISESKKAISILGGEIKGKIEYELPDSDIHRNLLLVKKNKMTPRQYPRKAGTPKREPIR